MGPGHPAPSSQASQWGPNTPTRRTGEYMGPYEPPATVLGHYRGPDPPPTKTPYQVRAWARPSPTANRNIAPERRTARAVKPGPSVVWLGYWGCCSSKVWYSSAG
jgi:hypothetical protein